MTTQEEPNPPEVPPQEPATSPEVREWIASSDVERLGEWLDTHEAGDVVHVVARLADGERDTLIRSLAPERAADLIELLPESQQVEALETLEPVDAARIVQELPSNEQADLLGEVENAEEILAALDPEEAREIRELVEYDDDTAGGLMITEYFAFPADLRVGDVVTRLQDAAEAGEDYDVQYVYVVDEAERLVGVLRLRDLLLSPRHRQTRTIMIADPEAVRVDAPLEHLAAFFDDHRFFGAPVVDAGGRLVGVVRASAVREALTERSDADYSKSQGIVGGDELRSMPLLVRARRRLSWLSLNVLLNVAGASVIARHQDTLEAVIALAVFLPIISDMSGCSGNQAVAVSMREMALNVTRPRDWLRVWGKECTVGVLNGLALGVLLGGLAWAWQGNPVLGLVVGGALAVNTVVAVSIGGVVPLVLKGFDLDPALASGPILTTVTDVCGFFLVLSLAAAAMAHLV